MKKFVRQQKPNGGSTPNIEINFGAASAKVAQLFEQGGIPAPHRKCEGDRDRKEQHPRCS
jgi:hypothetical protein